MRIPACLRLAPIVCLAPVLAYAQDVSLSRFYVGQPKGGEIQAPELKGSFKPEYPSALAKSGRPSYAMYSIELDEKGKVIVLNPLFSVPQLESVLIEEFSNRRWVPARKDGQPVRSRFSFAVLFNPASAALGLPDASARLLDVEPVMLQEETLGKSPVPKPAWVRLSVDEKGSVSAVAFDNSSLEPLRADVERAVKKWKLAPARKQGAPVASDLEVSVVFVRKNKPAAPGDKPAKYPRPIKQVEPDYPPAARGMDGSVKVSFVVDEAGNVSNPVVQSSDNPAFDPEAVRAVLKWKFEPAVSQAGKPMKCNMQVPMEFRYGGPGSGDKAAEVEKPRGNQSSIPDEFRCDVAPEVRGVVRGVYPHDMLLARKEGEVVMLAVVSETGRVIFTKLVSSSHESFTQSVRAYLEASEFTPGLREGKPHKALLRVERKFRISVNGGENLIFPEPASLGLLERITKDESSVLAKSKDLDSPIKAISRRAPVIPTSFELPKGSAVVSLIIDEEGRVRLPSVVSETHPGLGASAVQAVSQWLFEAPRSKGDKVKVRVQVPLSFNNTPVQPANKPAPATSAPEAGLPAAPAAPVDPSAPAPAP